jgi:hypothetical protein
MKKSSELKKLQQENEAFRKELKTLIIPKSKEWAWELINSLIENELKQEELCNE